MATLYTDKRGEVRIQWLVDGIERRSISIGSLSDSDAETWKKHVEHLLEVNEKGEPPSIATTKWLQQLGDKLHQRLAKNGLVGSRETKAAERMTLSKWLDTYIEERKDVKHSTFETYEKARDCLIAHFGKTKLLRDIRPHEANRWRIWLATSGNRRDKTRTTMADATVRRRTGAAKQFFTEAVSRGLVASNPFEKLTSHVDGNDKRQFFVPADWIERCIDVAPDVEWRTIIALARFGGLRCPSEVFRLKWEDVNLPEGTMVVHASKTEHHKDGGIRICPIFPELRPYLERAWDYAPDKAVYVCGRYGGTSINPRTTFEKVIKRAGLKPWPRLFQNLRATRETELLQKWPVADVVSWIGNSEVVAMKHYAMATDDSFKRAKVESCSELRAVLRAVPSVLESSQVTSDWVETQGNVANDNSRGVLATGGNSNKWAKRA